MRSRSSAASWPGATLPSRPAWIPAASPTCLPTPCHAGLRLAAGDGHQLNIHPWLATGWKLSDDQKSYTFTLRKDVKFHDGTPFNAQAVKIAFDRIKDPTVKSTSAIAILGPFYDGTEVVTTTPPK